MGPFFVLLCWFLMQPERTLCPFLSLLQKSNQQQASSSSCCYRSNDSLRLNSLLPTTSYIQIHYPLSYIFHTHPYSLPLVLGSMWQQVSEHREEASGSPRAQNSLTSLGAGESRPSKLPSFPQTCPAPKSTLPLSAVTS